MTHFPFATVSEVPRMYGNKVVLGRMYRVCNGTVARAKYFTRWTHYRLEQTLVRVQAVIYAVPNLASASQHEGIG